MPRFKQVDVFTKVKYFGNPVAVIYDADELTDSQMQDIARWTNLSETTFIIKPKSKIANYGLRIFTPTEELSFAGHPTLGSAFALLEDGKIIPSKNGKIYQECKAGLVEITISEIDKSLSFQLPYYKITSILNDVKNEVELILGKKSIGNPILIDDGPKWAVFEFESGNDVLNLNIDLNKIEKISKINNWTGIGVFGKHKDTGLYELRNIAPITGVPEDPACGSGSGAVGVYLSSIHSNSGISSFEITQGTPINRDAKIKVQIKDDDNNEGISIHVGGHAVTCFEGSYSI